MIGEPKAPRSLHHSKWQSMSDRLDLINDALQLAKSLRTILTETKELEQEIDSASTVLDDLRNHREPDHSRVERLGLGEIHGYALRMRVKGFISVNQKRLHKVKSKLKKDSELLAKISVCPYCEGSGEIIESEYVRNARSIEPRILTHSCRNCEGTGRLDLGDETSKIVESAKSLIDTI